MQASEPGPTAPRVAAWTAGGLAGLAGVLLLRQVDPTRPGSGLPPCPFHSVTGLYCPGCGATRALHALVHFDVAGALAMNPLLVLALPFVALLLADVAGGLPARWQARHWKVLDARPWAVLAIAFWVGRNLPWPPFAWLAPGA